MKVMWIWLWHQYLKLNKDYEQYCRAVEMENQKTISKLESQHTKIAEIYEDWGNLYKGSDKNLTIFYSWVASHHHLFYAKEAGPVKAITGELVVRGDTLIRIPLESVVSGDTLIRIPLDLDADDAIEQVTVLLKKLQKEGKHLRVDAKYSIYKSGVLDKTQVLALYKGLNVVLFDRMVKADNTEIKSNADIAKAIILREDKFWDWETEDVNIQSIKSGTVKSIDLQDQKRGIARYKKHAENTIANTLSGVFPVKDKIL